MTINGVAQMDLIFVESLAMSTKTLALRGILGQNVWAARCGSVQISE